MTIVNFTPIPALIGGALIGLSAGLALLLLGKVAGISGILGNLFVKDPQALKWRVGFTLGLVLGGVVLFLSMPAAFAMEIERAPLTLVVAGLMVGIGTALGSGCTSGHGICGIGRFSMRSIIATITFMGVGMLTAAIITHIFGGVL